MRSNEHFVKLDKKRTCIKRVVAILRRMGVPEKTN